ncbi:MAG: hypothetical protein SGILL_006056, partial [Bacillariaceae sp.]
QIGSGAADQARDHVATEGDPVPPEGNDEERGAAVPPRQSNRKVVKSGIVTDAIFCTGAFIVLRIAVEFDFVWKWYFNMSTELEELIVTGITGGSWFLASAGWFLGAKGMRDIRDDVRDLKKDVKDLKKGVKDLKKGVEDLNKKMDDHTQKMDEHGRKMDDHTQKMDEHSQKMDDQAVLLKQILDSNKRLQELLESKKRDD